MSFDPSAIGWFVLNVSVRAALAAAVVALVLRLMRMRSAGVRHAAWTLVLIAMLFMPVLPSVVPALPLPITNPVVTATAAPPPGAISYSRPSAKLKATVAASASRSGALTQSMSPNPRPAPTATPPAWWLLSALVAVYLAGVLFFLARLAYGWHLASRMVRRARISDSAHTGLGEVVYESCEVSVPMTVGVICPGIVVPVAWRAWDADTRAAVIAHEAAHVRRHDGLVLMIAGVNKALFWFHPLAWWLERTLAVAAEYACDEAAARVVAEPKRYAEILVDMADAVRRNRGRRVWQAVGVNGAGLLQERIDHVLREDRVMTTTKTKTFALLACGAAILLVIACRQQADVAPLKEDPALTQRLREQDANVKKFEAARDMTQEQVDVLEKTIESNPEDFNARRQLIIHYTASGEVPWDKKVDGQRRHALWLIQHYPEHDVTPPALSPRYDPDGFAAAKKLWDRHLAKSDVSPFLIYRAARFFAPHDKPYAEQLILRGMAMDPESTALKARMPPEVGGYQWGAQLADIYAAAINGSESMWGTYNDLRTDLAQLNSPFAQAVRKKLDTATDARLLASVGVRLARARGPEKNLEMKAAQDRTRTLGLGYLRRALQLDPNLESAKVSLYYATAREGDNEGARLARQAEEASIRGDGAREAAEKILASGKAHANDPAYSAAIMTAHQTLALAAARNGDRDRAVQHLKDSLAVPVSDEIRYAQATGWMRPVSQLLKDGERERVAQFLEAYAELNVPNRPRLLDDAKAIREGRMPASYQHMAYRETTPSPFKPMR